MGENVGGDGAEMTMMAVPLQNWLVGMVRGAHGCYSRAGEIRDFLG